MTPPPRTTQALIDELVRSSGEADAPSAIRAKARAVFALYESQFGPPDIPIDVDMLASLLGIEKSDEAPVLSPDAELVPDGQGRMTMRVNPDRPETRKRFSIAHEISHTFFPEYAGKEWCRTDARYRNRDNPDDFLEMLCDIGAAELLLPEPWFSKDAAEVDDAAGLLRLANTYHASREAVLRRFAETSSKTIAAVFFQWKLKPTQKGRIGNKDQGNLFGFSPEEEVRDSIRLRIDYTIPSTSFRAEGHFLPGDKSVESEGPLYEAASTGKPVEGEFDLDLGQATGRYRILAIPLWTPNEQLGAQGENAVAALLTPLSVRRPSSKRRDPHQGPTLFSDT
ncbi:ImmA/IrrE family metallo-endopeptidase [Planctomicrobium sp. SH661]|uniref:ImmA/IrrE family metallo-endopeptidase n=1 Tax=Planctomicrobium sp. SH661 TaxID=3448124 RepID=UPI003F5B7852